ncbi:MAG: YlxR family protein [Actinomycetota bacterium]|nr:YlxR family protein [Actinomycetota bacterium]
MCVGCRQRTTKRELLRIVAGEDAHGPAASWAVVPDPRGTAAGRGAHLHPTTDCLALAERKRAFPRALRVQKGLSTQTLREYVERLTHPTDREGTGA